MDRKNFDRQFSDTSPKQILAVVEAFAPTGKIADDVHYLGDGSSFEIMRKCVPIVRRKDGIFE